MFNSLQPTRSQSFVVLVFLGLTHLVNMDCVQRSGLPTAQMTASHLGSGERPRQFCRWVSAPTRSVHGDRREQV